MRSRIVAFVVVALFCVIETLVLSTLKTPSAETTSVSPTVEHVSMQLLSTTNALTSQAYSNLLNYWKYVEAAAANINAEKERVSELADATIPQEWIPTAKCEEHMSNDSNYGYFGIKEWNGFDGYSKAGSAPLQIQLAWEAKYIGGPPDAPGQCHSY